MTTTTAALSWSTHQLAEYFIAVCAQQDEVTAIRVAVERATEALEAEVGAAILGGEVKECFGLPAGSETDGLYTVAAGAPMAGLPGLGAVHGCGVRLERGSTDGLVVARLNGAFGVEERQMFQGMAQVLGLALRNLRTVTAGQVLLHAFQQRQRLLETLLDIQRAISNRRPLEDVLAAVTGGASRLLDQAVVALMLTDPYDPTALIMASTSASHLETGADVAVRAAAAQAMAGTAAEQYRRSGTTNEPMTAVVKVDGEIAGCLVANAALEAAAEDRLELLGAFAQQVSLALTDARTVEAMREAYHDSLTSLPNRKLFIDRLQHALITAQRRAEALSVLFVDLDRFKAVNDSL